MSVVISNNYVNSFFFLIVPTKHLLANGPFNLLSMFLLAFRAQYILCWHRQEPCMENWIDCCFKVKSAPRDRFRIYKKSCTWIQSSQVALIWSLRQRNRVRAKEDSVLVFLLHHVNKLPHNTYHSRHYPFAQLCYLLDLHTTWVKRKRV